MYMYSLISRFVSLRKNGMYCLLTAASSAACAGNLIVNAETMDGTSGQLVVKVFNSAETFRKSPTVQVTVPADQQNAQGQITAVIQGLPAGEYALVAFHDKLGDGKLARNQMGIPTEPYAFSGQASRMGPPAFREAAFSLTTSGATINLKFK